MNILKREGLSNIKKPVFKFVSNISIKEWIKQEIKVSTLDIRIKKLGSKVSHSKVPSSGSVSGSGSGSDSGLKSGSTQDHKQTKEQ